MPEPDTSSLPVPPRLAARLLDEQSRRWDEGDAIPIEAYLEQYPELRDDADGLLDLIFNEILMREEQGAVPDPGEYAVRFPWIADRLRSHFAVHEFMRPETAVRSAADQGERPAGPRAGLPDVAGYEVLGEIGRGGMGVVYRARHRALGRLVALKMVLAGPYARPEEVRRLQAEAEAVARVQHPNIVQIYEVGTHEGRPYLALEYVAGERLDRRTAGAPQPPRESARLIETLARAVHAAHQAGIVHRDLKPANILLAEDRGQRTEDRGQTAGDGKDQGAGTFGLSSVLCPLSSTPKITDFGLAKRLDDGGPGPTRSGDFVGTPAYAAPEQVGGKVGEIGPATDVYALGAILYELLTGRPLFQSATPLETLLRVRTEEPLPPRRLQPKLPRDLETICLKCLHKEARRRYAGALDLAEDVRRFLEGRPIQARPVGAAGRGWRWCRRNPGWAAMLGAVVVLLTIIAVGASIGVVRLNTLLGRAQQAERATQEKLFESYIEKARALRRSQRLGQRFDSLETIRQALQLAHDLDLPSERIHELRNEAIGALALLDLRPVREWVGATAPSVAFDPDLERYARCDVTGAVSLRRVADDVELLRLDGFGGPDNNYWPRFSPDGRYLSVWQEHGGRVKAWRLDRDPPEPVPDVPSSGDLSVPAFSSDSRSLACALSDGTVVFVELDGGGTRRLPPADGARGCAWFGLAWHPDCRRFAMATWIGSRGVVQIRERDSGRVLATLTGLRGKFYDLAWHPGGQILAVADFREIRLWDMVADGWTAELYASHTGGTKLDFTPSGDLLASTDWNGETRLWEPHFGSLLFKADTGLATVQFSRDGRLLAGNVWAAAMPKLRVWEVPRRCYRRLRPLPASNEACWSPTVCPNDRLLAAGFGTSVGLWDLQSGQQLVTLPGIGKYTTGLAFNGDGALWTFGESGLWRWPVKGPQAETSKIGPPVSSALPAPRSSTDPLSADRQGRLLALRTQTGQWALHVGPSPRWLRLGTNQGDGVPWVSPDGRWIALANTASQKVRLLDPSTGSPLREVPLEGLAGLVGSSPDGRWVVATDKQNRFHLWRTDTGEPSAPVPGNSLVVAPDSRLLAVETGEGRIRLLDPAATNRELAVLEDPHQDLVPRESYQMMTFTRDGAQLITASWRATPALHIWDLRLLRQQLAELDLDWEQDPYPPAKPARPSPLPRYIVDRGRLPLDPQAGLILYSLAIALQPLNPEAYYQRALAHSALAYRAQDEKSAEHYTRAAADAHRAAAYHPDWPALIARTPVSPVILNNLAWACVVRPVSPQEAEFAVLLAERAIKLESATAIYSNTLGVANYRAGRYREAVAALEKSLAAGHGESDAFDLYFLAMSHHALGDGAKAADCYHRAVKWVQEQQGKLRPHERTELTAFRAETEAVLAKQPSGPR